MAIARFNTYHDRSAYFWDSFKELDRKQFTVEGTITTVRQTADGEEERVLGAMIICRGSFSYYTDENGVYSHLRSGTIDSMSVYAGGVLDVDIAQASLSVDDFNAFIGFQDLEGLFLHVLKGDDVVYGSPRSDVLDGGTGVDTVYSGNGSDGIFVDHVNDMVVENYNEGNDTVYSSVIYTLPANVENLVLSGSANLNAYGNAEANVLTGNSGKNILIGHAGDDTLAGEAGDDVLQGGPGANALDGGAGSDRAVYAMSRNQYAIVVTADGYGVTGADSADSLASIEFITFADQTIELAKVFPTDPNAESASFSEEYYLLRNPDVASAVDAGIFATGWEHFNLSGLLEGRMHAAPEDFSDFDEQYYLARNPDVAAAITAGLFASAWLHYDLHGRDEGRSIAPPEGEDDFSELYYLLGNPDVARAVQAGLFATGWEHYSLYGYDEGRSYLMPEGYDSFDEVYYLAANPDVAAAVDGGIFTSGWEHYILAGKSEGRSPFDQSADFVLTSGFTLAATSEVFHDAPAGEDFDVFESGATGDGDGALGLLGIDVLDFDAAV
jgi:hypothetical protein